MSEHTPGPWSVYYATAEIWVEDENGRIIWGPMPRDSDENVEWDAILIAAAPMMLEALERMEHDTNKTAYGFEDGEWPALDDIRQAITKATGRKA